MLTIKKPYVEEKDEMATLITEVDEDGTAKRLSATVEKEYAEYLCYERADAALIGLLSYALRHKHDIVCEAPVTDELLYNINEVLFPALMKNDSDNYHVKIQCDTAECIEKCSHAGGVGTGLSCGVDSFHAVAKHYNSPYKNNALTHVAIYNAGSFNAIYKYSGLDYVQNKVWERAKTVAKELGLPIVAVNTNIHKEFLQNHYLTHTYTDMFAVYCLQKLWKTYYYASTYDYSDFTVDGNLNIDPAHYEILLLNCFSTSRLRIYSDGASKIRDDKIELIADFEPARKYLHVCTAKEVNCGHCEKCMRTLLELDATGNLDKFREVFDIDGYKKNRSFYYRNLCKQKVLGNAYLQKTFEVLYEKNKEEFDKYLAEFTLENRIKRVDELSRLVDTWRGYTSVFEEALDKEKVKADIHKRLSDRKAKTVAFYGDGELRRYLYGIIKDFDDISVKYMVEDGKFDWLPFPTYRRTQSELPQTDLMIITDVLHYAAISKMLSRSGDFDIIAGRELIISDK